MLLALPPVCAAAFDTSFALKPPSRGPHTLRANPLNAPHTMELPRVIGHRGAKAVAPENTLASIRAAKACGCTWVEVDVMLTKDKVPVIHHDVSSCPCVTSTLASSPPFPPLPRVVCASDTHTCTRDTQNTLDRCTDGEGNLWDYTVAEIEALDAGSHFSPEAAGERIPRLTALLQCCRDLSLGLNLEVKHVTEHAPEAPTAREQEMEEELANVVCDTIEKLNVQPSDLAFSSFSRPAVAVLRRRLPHFRCAFLVEAIPDDWQQFMAAHQCLSLNFDWKNPANTPARIEACARQALCYSYTVNDGEVAHKLLSLGVRGVFSDCPHLVSDALARLDRQDCQAAAAAAAAAAAPAVGADVLGALVRSSSESQLRLVDELGV